MNVPFVDLKQQHQALKPQILEAFSQILDTAHFCLGPEVEAFEREFAEAHQVAHAVAVNTGTSALQLALQAVGVEAGDEVITVAMTFVATASAIHYLGAKPVYVDVDPVRYTMDPSQIRSKITSKTKAIMPVHLYGQPADMDQILAIADEFKLKVVEDAAQAHLARYKGKSVGNFGHATGFSFYPGKNLGAVGEGGMVVCNDPEIAKTLRMLRDWGQSTKYYHDLVGYNFRMDALQGAALRIKLAHLADWTQKRNALAHRYHQLLADLPLGLPKQFEDCDHVYHVYSVQLPQDVDRNQLQKELNQLGVQTGIHYPVPCHLQKAYNDGSYKPGDFPVAESIGARTLSLPMFPEMTHAQQDHVVASMRSLIGSNSSLKAQV
jgi:dTDP-4-amino-4,6-dideoxygalactose transaminase